MNSRLWKREYCFWKSIDENCQTFFILPFLSFIGLGLLIFRKRQVGRKNKKRQEIISFLPFGVYRQPLGRGELSIKVRKTMRKLLSSIPFRIRNNARNEKIRSTFWIRTTIKV
ncbi:hypothetical protein A2608_01715 [Candidatus Azambacteria bacterium RIFOXYD1_FULL_44_10]|nr:MAG: hypothetical protein A2608_01715 [Candidatus Azambacteria bacterium RIFOXYD1_FULL_44_10]